MTTLETESFKHITASFHSHLLASSSSNTWCPLAFWMLFFKQNTLGCFSSFKQGSALSRSFHWPYFYHSRHIHLLSVLSVYSPFSWLYLCFTLENELGGPSVLGGLTIIPESEVGPQSQWLVQGCACIKFRPKRVSAENVAVTLKKKDFSFSKGS